MDDARFTSAAAVVKTPSAGVRLLVLADDAERGDWLRYRIQLAAPDAAVTVIDTAEFKRRIGHPRRADWDLVLALLDCGDEDGPAASPGLQWLSRLAIRSETAPLAVIAEAGNELSAVLALRLGAIDYMPSGLVTTPALATLLERAPRTRTAALPSGEAAAINPRETAPHLPRRLLDGRRRLVPGYQVLQTLGESLRATVYLASSEALGRHVALKVSRGNAEDSGFAHEYTTLRALRTPAVIEIHEYGVHDGREYLAMEYFPCGDLRARLLNPMSDAEAVEYLRRIAGALATVHRAGMRHGDLKPGNIMLRPDGKVVLIDFGLTAPFSDRSQSAVTSMLRGSPYYMSPEHAQGAPLDERSDLYSLGVVFHELLTGQKPYSATHAIEVLHRHVEDPLPVLPDALAAHQPLLERLMAKSPDERFRTADEVLRALTPLGSP
ncbi:MAG: hypothetical protein RLZZ393_1400 [Pseudomonadota bacterium]|jgi:ActR/RegA family two-component response regulator